MRRIVYVVEYRLKHWPADVWDDISIEFHEINALACMAHNQKEWEGSEVERPEYRVTQYEIVSR